MDFVEMADEVRKQIDAANDELKKIADIGVTWQTSSPDDAALLATQNAVFVGGDDRVTAYSADTGDVVWQSEVDGRASGLAVADETARFDVFPLSAWSFS